MMRFSGWMSTVAVTAVLGVGMTAASASRAGGDEELVDVSCKAGHVTVKGKAPWHTNDKAPWKWDKGEKVSVDDHEAKFKGAKCEGTIKAFVCSGDKCKGPIVVPVK